MKAFLNNIKLLLTAFLLISGINCKTFKNMEKTIDYVPDQETAVKIAEAIWLPIYGEKVLNFKPYKAVLKDNTVWIVEGTSPKGMKGGTPYIEINKEDCRVIKVTHGK
jgi:hypothetical protein